jgi:hypothetical protein
MKIGPWVARKRKAFWEARFAVAVANCNASMISLPPLFTSETVVTDEPRVCGMPGIVVHVFTDCTAGVGMAANAVVGWLW